MREPSSQDPHRAGTARNDFTCSVRGYRCNDIATDVRSRRYHGSRQTARQCKRDGTRPRSRLEFAKRRLAGCLHLAVVGSRQTRQVELWLTLKKSTWTVSLPELRQTVLQVIRSGDPEPPSNRSQKGIIDSVLRGMMGNLHRHVLCERGKPLADRLPVRVLDVCTQKHLEPAPFQQDRRREVILLGFRILSGERLSRMEGGQLGLSNMSKGVLPRPPPTVRPPFPVPFYFCVDLFQFICMLILRGRAPVVIQAPDHCTR